MSMTCIEMTGDGIMMFTVDGESLGVPFATVCHAADDIREMYGCANKIMQEKPKDRPIPVIPPKKNVKKIVVTITYRETVSVNSSKDSQISRVFSDGCQLSDIRSWAAKYIKREFIDSDFKLSKYDGEHTS